MADHGRNTTSNDTNPISKIPLDDFDPQRFYNFYTFMGSFIAGSACCSFLLNGLVIAVLIKYIRTITNTNIIVLSMSCANILIPLLGSPLSATSSLMRKWQFGNGGCTWYGFINTLSGISGIYHLTFLSFERFITIVLPLKRDTILSTKNIYIGLGILWVAAIGVAGAPVFGWCEYIKEGVRTSCSVAWSSKENMNVFSYNLFMIFTVFLLPMLVIIYCNYRFIKEVSIMSTRARGLQGGDSEMTASASKAEKQLTIMVITMIIAFNIAWLPYTVVSMVFLTGYGDVVGPMGASVPSVFAKTSVIYNPVIYCLLNRSFRKMLCGNSVEPE
uniref:Opsin-like protein n=1 Tax=Tripedalia cystophora TaxID=6141 RepID=A0A4D5XWB3_TRICY|nr:opsin-like protein [Tripedalia cystophora]